MCDPPQLPVSEHVPLAEGNVSASEASATLEQNVAAEGFNARGAIGLHVDTAFGLNF